jgi:hypothetical protein
MDRKRQRQLTKSTSVAILDAPNLEENQCNHYWIIESPRGPTSSGICKFCGTRKEFDNWGPDSFRYGDMSEVLAPRVSEMIDGGPREVANDALADSM